MKKLIGLSVTLFLLAQCASTLCMKEKEKKIRPYRKIRTGKEYFDPNMEDLRLLEALLDEGRKKIKKLKELIEEEEQN